MLLATAHPSNRFLARIAHELVRRGHPPPVLSHPSPPKNLAAPHSPLCAFRSRRNGALPPLPLGQVLGRAELALMHVVVHVAAHDMAVLASSVPSSPFSSSVFLFLSLNLAMLTPLFPLPGPPEGLCRSHRHQGCCGHDLLHRPLKPLRLPNPLQRLLTTAITGPTSENSWEPPSPRSPPPP
jgi:hypothetical protein